MLKRWFLPLTVLLVLAAALLFGKHWVGTNTPYRIEDAVPVSRYTLQNGLEVVVIPNDRVPAVTQMLWLKAGGADDPGNLPGIAHFLEHLMFTGTPEYPEGAIDDIVQRLGGQHNAFTTYDTTSYFVTIAKEHLETVMALEADRLQHITFDDAKAAREVKVIQEERKMRVSNRPLNLLREQMGAIQFLSHPYHHPLIGWEDSIARYTAEDAREFFKNYYRASNMVLVIAGDVEPKQVRALAGKYFGPLSAGEPVVRDWPSEQPLATERRVTMRHPSVTQPRVLKYVTVPSVGTSKDMQALHALEIYAHMLGGDATGMLHRKLVHEQQIATEASAYVNTMQRGPATFEISVTPAPGVSIKTVEAAVQRVLNDMANVPLNTGDIARAKTQLAAEAIYAQDGVQQLAMIIGQLYAMGLNEEYFYRWQQEVHAVPATSIAQVARSMLEIPAVTGVLLPETNAKDATHAQRSAL